MNFKGEGSKNINMMGKIAKEIVMQKAFEDKKKMEMEKKLNKHDLNYVEVEEHNYDNENLSDMSMDSEEEEIVRQMKEKMNYTKEQQNQEKLITGMYQEKSEKEFFELIKNKKEKIICHFFHEDFVRCKIIHKHLSQIAFKHPETLFIRVNAQGAPFLVQKLAIRVLPAIYFFQDGVVKDTIIGFEEFGSKDDFQEYLLSRRLAKKGGITLLEEEKFKVEKKHKNNIVKGDELSDDED
jgi:hypothetical protein